MTWNRLFLRGLSAIWLAVELTTRVVMMAIVRPHSQIKDPIDLTNHHLTVRCGTQTKGVPMLGSRLIEVALRRQRVIEVVLSLKHMASSE